MKLWVRRQLSEKYKQFERTSDDYNNKDHLKNPKGGENDSKAVAEKIDFRNLQSTVLESFETLNFDM